MNSQICIAAEHDWQLRKNGGLGDGEGDPAERMNTLLHTHEHQGLEMWLGG